MQRTFLKSKIHRAKITEANLLYEGSFTIDEDLMDEAEILAYEKIHIYNINSGERIETYVIPGARGSRVFALNGAAARKGQVGDQVIAVTYINLEPDELDEHRPTVLILDKDNKIIEKTHSAEHKPFIIKN